MADQAEVDAAEASRADDDDALPSTAAAAASAAPPPSSPSRRPVVSLVTTCEEMNPSRRCSMEDCSMYRAAGTWGAPDPGMALLCICDGHGGREMVEYLEDGLVYHVAQELRHGEEGEDDDEEEEEEEEEGGEGRQSDDATPTDGEATTPAPASARTIPMSTRLERAFMMADVHSKTLGVDTSGATVALCLVKREGETRWTVHSANAGDARIVLGHNRGEAFRLTRDHRTDDPEEVQRIEGSGGFMFKGRVLGVLAVTRSLGDHCMKEYVISKPFCQEKSITKEHEDDPVFLILACDGLWDVMEDQEAVAFVMNRLDEKNLVAEYLVREALRRGSTDNITVQVAWL